MGHTGFIPLLTHLTIPPDMQQAHSDIMARSLKDESDSPRCKCEEHIRQEEEMCMSPLAVVEVMRGTVAGGMGKAWTSRAVLDPFGTFTFS